MYRVAEHQATKLTENDQARHSRPTNFSFGYSGLVAPASIQGQRYERLGLVIDPMGDAPGLGGLPEPRRDKRIVRPGEGGQIDLGFEPADVKHLVRRQAAADRARQEERAAYGPPAAVPYPQDRDPQPGRGDPQHPGGGGGTREAVQHGSPGAPARGPGGGPPS